MQSKANSLMALFYSSVLLPYCTSEKNLNMGDKRKWYFI